MLAYEFYARHALKEHDLLGILPERRKDPQRITDASIMKWRKMFFGNNIFYVEVTIGENMGKFFLATPSNIRIQN